MAGRVRSLRSTVLFIMGLLVGLALAAVLTLIFLSTHLHKQTVQIANTVQSVELAHEAEVDLLLHSRAADPAVRAGIETDLRRRLEDAHRYIATKQEERLLHETELAVARYFAAGRGGGESEMEAAIAMLERFVEENAVQARTAEREAAHWDAISNFVGFAVACALLAGVFGVILWLRSRVVRPIIGISTAMQRFGEGERDARAPPATTREVDQVGRTFNEMADAVQRQQGDQLAFLAGVAHDLRNPLNALKLGVGAFSPESPLPPEARVRAVLGIVSRQVARLDRMVGDFLDASRIESGRLDLQFEACDLRTLATEASELFAAASPDHELDLHLPDHPVPLRCDPTRIAQVLNNLISNAIKYSPRGGSVTITVRQEGDWALLSVTDHGIGMTTAERAQIFAPFRRVGVSRETIPGVGLGLFVSRRIVEAHGGLLAVESEEGSGSTFHLRLPRDPRAAAQIYC